MKILLFYYEFNCSKSKVCQSTLQLGGNQIPKGFPSSVTKTKENFPSQRSPVTYMMLWKVFKTGSSFKDIHGKGDPQYHENISGGSLDLHSSSCQCSIGDDSSIIRGDQLPSPAEKTPWSPYRCTEKIL